MRRLSRFGRGSKVLLAVCLGAATFGIVSAVQAAIPDANGVIHGCYQYAPQNNQYGKLRVFDTAKGGGCNQFEHPLNWNQTGPTGPTGPSGVIALYAISGPPDGNIPSGADQPWVTPDWSFQGPTAQVTVTDEQSIVASIGGSFAHVSEIEAPTRGSARGAAAAAADPSTEFGFGVCFQDTGGGPVVNMNQFSGGNINNFAVGQYEQAENDYTGLGAVTPGAGTYDVGYCIDNYGQLNLNNNNWVNGWVQVVEGTVDTGGVSQVAPVQKPGR